jgi:hypothetical protein
MKRLSNKGLKLIEVLAIVFIAVAFLVVIVSALTPGDELSQLEQDLIDLGCFGLFENKLNWGIF